MITQGEWINGYGIGVTGPTTPVDRPTVHEAVEYQDWVDEGQPGDEPDIQHTIVSCGTITIAIIPTIKPEGSDNAALITAAPKLLAACRKYGRHKNNCNLMSAIPCTMKGGKSVSCTCGWDETKAAIEAAKPGAKE